MNRHHLLSALSLLVASRALAASLTLDRSPVILGRTESVGVTLHVEEAPGTEDRPLRLAVNVGSFSAAQRTGPGTFRSVYVPPGTRFPQVALVAVWKETGPEAPIDFLRIPLHGVAKVPVQAGKRAEVRLVIDEREFGPVTADRSGKALVTAEVPPDAREALILAKDGTGETRRKVPFEVPPYNRLTAALVPHAVVADGQSPARLEIFYDLGGADVPASKLDVSPSLGEAVFERAEKGRYVYRYLAPAGASAEAVEFKVAVRGDPVARAKASLKLGLPPAAKLVVRVPDAPLPCDGASSSPVTVIAFDGAGMGLAGQKLRLTANGGELGNPVYRGNGTYEFAYVAPKSYPSGGLVQFVAEGEGVTASANYQLRAPPVPKTASAQFHPSPVPSDGRTEAQVVLEVRDASGRPLPDAQLTVVATHGQVGALRNAGEGRYRAELLPPASLPDGELELRVVDITGSYEQRIAVPLRADPHRLLLGVRGGFTHNLATQLGARAGADVWVPLRLGSSVFGVGAAAEWGSARQSLTDATGAFSTDSTVHYVPLQLRVGYELYASRRLTLLLGAAGVAAWARYATSLNGEQVSAWGFGGLGYLSLGIGLGPGLAFFEAGYGAAPVSTSGKFRLEAAGLELALGYRFGVL